MTFKTKNHVVDGRIIGVIIEAEGFSLPRISKKRIIKTLDALTGIVIFLILLFASSIQ